MPANLRFSVALHILTLLAANGTGLLTSEEIASSVDTNPVVIRRVMASLRENGLVESRPGVNGGWRLKKTPASITLCKVFETVREDDLLAMHAHPNPDCPIGGISAIRCTRYLPMRRRRCMVRSRIKPSRMCWKMCVPAHKNQGD